jgi:hypothetical protein
MAEREPRVEQLAKLHTAVMTLRERTSALQRSGAALHDWRRLQYDALVVYLDGQRSFVAIQSMLLTSIKADRDVHQRQRAYALELFSALTELHDVMRCIEDCAAEADV